MLAVLLGCAGAVWLRLWQPLQAQLGAQTTALAELTGRLDALDAWQATASDDLSALEGRNRGLTARLDQLGPARLAAWSLAEANYLVRSAQRAAHFDYDPARAALALSLASASLSPVPDSSAARAAIDSARAALENVQVPDIDALGSEFTQAANTLKAAPLREPGTPAPQSAGPTGWRGAAQQAWSQLSDVIVVQRGGAPVQPLLRPDEGQYLRQQLALKLTAADQALRRRDSAALASELTDVSQWAQAYLDGSTPGTVSALAVLTKLTNTDLRPPLPDLSDLSDQLATLARAASPDRNP